MPRTWVRPRAPGRPALLARLRALAVDLRVDADVVERPGQNCHHDGAGLRAVADGAVVVTALPSGDRADNEPDNENDRSDAHWTSAGAAGPIREMSMKEAALDWGQAAGLARLMMACKPGASRKVAVSRSIRCMTRRYALTRHLVVPCWAPQLAIRPAVPLVTPASYPDSPHLSRPP